MERSKFYRVSLDPPPTIIYETVRSHKNYKFHYFPDSARDCELNYIVKGNLIENQNGLHRTLEEGTLFSFIHDHEFVLHCNEPIYQEVCLGLRFSESPVLMTDDQVRNWNPLSTGAILPSLVRDRKVSRHLSLLLQNAIRHKRDRSDPAQGMNIRISIMEIFAALTEYAVTQMRSDVQGPYMTGYRFCRMACAYIAEHLHEKILVEDVAKQLGISYSYLIKLFARHMNIPIVRYINREKIRVVEDLILNHGQTIEEAGRAVGIADSKYLSSLFRQYTGMTVTDYRYKNKNLTLDEGGANP